MAKYKLVLEFDADSDEEAGEQVFGTEDHPEWGAQDCFGSIHSVHIYNESGAEV